MRSFDFCPLLISEFLGPPARVLRDQEVEPVRADGLDDISSPVRAGEGHLGNLSGVQAAGGQQDHLGTAPGHHWASGATYCAE